MRTKVLSRHDLQRLAVEAVRDVSTVQRVLRGEASANSRISVEIAAKRLGIEITIPENSR